VGSQRITASAMAGSCKPFCWKQKDGLFPSSEKGLETTFNSMSNLKFCIKVKNEYPNLHEIAIDFFFFPPHVFAKLDFLSRLCLKRNRRTA
jgi:hypothetical protein